MWGETHGTYEIGGGGVKGTPWGRGGGADLPASLPILNIGLKGNKTFKLMESSTKMVQFCYQKPY